MIAHHRLVYADLADPAALLRAQTPSTQLGEFWAYDAEPTPGSEAAAQAYSRLMAESLPLLIEDVVEAYPIGAHRCVMDVGGGTGHFLRALAGRNANTRFILVDLPAVVAEAAREFEEAGLSARIAAVGADARRMALPKGADLATLIRVLHDHDDPDARAILRAIRESLPPGGVLMIAEPMAGIRGAERVADAYFGFYFLAMGRGRARSPEEIRALLNDAGFEGFRALPMRRPIFASAVIASVPEPR
jgi:demethylspheroidene O-methyltransferase